MMKKAISISLAFLMLTAMLHFFVAIHYCGGKIAASKISLSGKLASCGMEADIMENPLQGTNLRSHCCDNVLIFYGISSNYFPSFSFIPESLQHTFPFLLTSLGLPAQSLAVLMPFYKDVSPPDVLLSTSVDLSDICVFRI
jgi:hypothetical protein